MVVVQVPPVPMVENPFIPEVQDPIIPPEDFVDMTIDDDSSDWKGVCASAAG